MPQASEYEQDEDPVDPPGYLEDGGRLDADRGLIRSEPFTGNITMKVFGMRFTSKVVGPPRLAVLWFGSVGALGGGLLWAAGTAGAGIAVMIMTLIVVSLYLLRPS